MSDPEKNGLTNGIPRSITLDQVASLMQQLERNEFWGTLKLYYQGGRLVQGEVSQTLKQLASDANILVIVKE